MFGNSISWSTKKQNHVALSSAEAEFVTVSKTCKDIVNIKDMCKQLLKKDIIPIIHCDNNEAIKIAMRESP